MRAPPDSADTPRAGRERLAALRAAGDRAGIEALLIEHGDLLLAQGAAEEVLAAVEPLDPRSAGLRLVALVGYARQLTGDFLGALTLLRTATGDGPLEPVLAHRMGELHFLAGRPEEAVGCLERAALDQAGLDEESRPEVVALLCAAVGWLRAAGADDRARETAKRAFAVAERGGDPPTIARAHACLALMAAYDGDRAEHDVHHFQALRMATQLGAGLLRLSLHINRASYLAEEGAPAEAMAEADTALELGRELGVGGYWPLCHSIRGRALTRLSRFEEALAEVVASQRMWRQIGPSFDAAFGQLVRGEVHRRRGEPGRAQAILTEALRACDGPGMRPLQAVVLASQARVRAADDVPAAVELAERAVPLAPGTGRVPALLARGWVRLLAGDRAGAAADAEAARSMAGARRDAFGLAEGLELAVLSAPEPVAAAGLLSEAGALWAELGDPVGAARVALVAARLAGPTGVRAAEAATRTLGEHGVRVDSGVADALAVPAVAPPLAVRVLGAFEVLRAGEPVGHGEWKSKKARDLFKILVVNRGRPVARERLTDLLWPKDPADARTANRLSVLLSTLRGVLEAGAVRADRDAVALDLDQVVVDVEVFLAQAAAAQSADRCGDPAAVELLAAADAAYGGELLPEDRYDEWSESLRDLARAAHVAVLRALLRHAGDADERARHLLRLLDHDAYDEPAHRQLVGALRAAGRHGEAQRRYEVYARRMREIGIEPAPFELCS